MHVPTRLLYLSAFQETDLDFQLIESVDLPHTHALSTQLSVTVGATYQKVHHGKQQLQIYTFTKSGLNTKA
jgi:hypothetical protein